MKAQIVSFRCVLKSKLGKVLSSSFNKDVINQLEEGTFNDDPRKMRGLVAGMQNMRAGERRQIAVSANEAYGLYDPNLVLSVPRWKLRKGNRLVVGAEIKGQAGPRDSQRLYRVTQIDGDTVVLDANHPLAGQDLIFDIEVVSARDARSEDYDEAPSSSVLGRYLH
jgi:FKBP-type peptidyl-prolyl cis-trans isomerase SlyD